MGTHDARGCATQLENTSEIFPRRQSLSFLLNFPFLEVKRFWQWIGNKHFSLSFLRSISKNIEKQEKLRLWFWHWYAYNRQIHITSLILWMIWPLWFAKNFWFLRFIFSDGSIYSQWTTAISNTKLHPQQLFSGYSNRYMHIGVGEMTKINWTHCTPFYNDQICGLYVLSACSSFLTWSRVA